MSVFLAAIDEFIRRSKAGGTLQELQTATMGVHQKLAAATATDRTEALHRLNAALPGMHPVPAAKVAVTCGALVENGADPHISGAAVLQLLPPTLDATIRFHEHCARKAGAAGQTTEEEDPAAEELAKKYFGEVHTEDPQAAFAYMGMHDITLAVIAHLARSKQLRAAARARSDGLLNKSLAHDRVYPGGHSFLTKMLLVLDDEPLLMLDTDQNRGYRITFGGIPDNFTLNTQIMGRLIGDPKQGWIEVAGFDRKAIDYAMTHVCGKDAPTLTGIFNLWNWTALQPDATLPKPASASEHWIWNEGVPADIAAFDGARVVILGPPAYSRSWPGGLIFSGLTPEFVVQEKLPESVVRDWLRRLAAAPRSGAAKVQ